MHPQEAAHGVHRPMNGLVILKQLDPFGNETAFGLLFPGQTCGWRSLFLLGEQAAPESLLMNFRRRR